MNGVYIYVAVLIILFVICIVWYTKKISKPVVEMHKVGVGERTKFIVNTADNGYEYCKKKIESWLINYGWKKKGDGYTLKYHKDGSIFNFGFNYYKESDNIVIQAWLNVLGGEYPLTQKLYEEPENETTVFDVLHVVAKKENDIEMDDVETKRILVGQQGKDEYIEFLRTLISIEDEIKEENIVKLLNEVDLSKKV